MSYNEIIHKVYELIDELKTSDLYKNYLRLKEEAKDFTNLLEEYQMEKLIFDNLEGGKYNPSFKVLAKQLQDKKLKVFDNPVLRELNNVESTIQSILDEYSREIASAISPEIKAPNELGILNICNH